MRGIGRQRLQPCLRGLGLAADERLIVEGIRQRGDALAAREQMHRQRIRVAVAAHRLELHAQPAAELPEDHACIAGGDMVELGQFRAQRAHRAAMPLDVAAVAHQHADETTQPPEWRVGFAGPVLEHRLRPGRAQCDHRGEDFVLALEVVVEVAARQADLPRDVGERCFPETLPVEQGVGGFDDAFARARAGGGVKGSGGSGRGHACRLGRLS